MKYLEKAYYVRAQARKLGALGNFYSELFLIPAENEQEATAKFWGMARNEYEVNTIEFVKQQVNQVGA